MNNKDFSAGTTDEQRTKADLSTSASVEANPMLSAVYVYSGKCKMGKIGEPTVLIDFTMKPLFVGDIVIVSTIDKTGICNNTGLSVIVSAEYNNSLISEENWSEGYFVMGIKNVDFMGKDSGEWIVKKVKDWSDVVIGEHWKDYGFNYGR